jgi:hypothetical protein
VLALAKVRVRPGGALEAQLLAQRWAEVRSGFRCELFQLCDLSIASHLEAGFAEFPLNSEVFQQCH